TFGFAASTAVGGISPPGGPCVRPVFAMPNVAATSAAVNRAGRWKRIRRCIGLAPTTVGQGSRRAAAARRLDRSFSSILLKTTGKTQRHRRRRAPDVAGRGRTNATAAGGKLLRRRRISP